MGDQQREECDFLLHHDDYSDEALSLCDLAMGEEDGNDSERSPRHARRSTAEEFFEFLNDFNSEMCSAEDIIVCGKLAPSDVGNTVRRRSESLSEVKLGSSIRSDVFKSGVMRTCRSLDDDKIHHHSFGSAQRFLHLRRLTTDQHSFESSGLKNRPLSRPRWYVIMFGGPVSNNAHRLREIKSRQLRRSPSNLLFPPTETDFYTKESTGRVGFKDSSWKFLQLLSCQSRSSVAVTSSYSTCNKA